MPYDVEWKQGAIEDVTALFDYIAENSSLWDARNVTDRVLGHCCKVSDEAAFCLIQRPYISKTLLTRRISPRGSP